MYSCPQCNGFGKLAMPTLFLQAACPLCEGSGEVAEYHLDWKAQGAELKANRIKARLGLREAARQQEMDASNLSKMERGLIKPKAIKY